MVAEEREQLRERQSTVPEGDGDIGEERAVCDGTEQSIEPCGNEARQAVECRLDLTWGIVPTAEGR